MPLIDDFNNALRRAGWQVEDFSALRNAGVALDPLGMARYETRNVVLEVQLSSNGELKLFILEKAQDRMIRLVFAPGEGNMCRILYAVVEEQDKLAADNFPLLIHKSRYLADSIFFVDHEGQRFHLEFEP